VVETPYGISICVDGHVVVSFSETSTVRLFTHEGVLQRSITVDQVVNLRHAVVLDTGQLVICHGDLQHRAGVSIVDADGHLLKTLPAEADPSQPVWPTHDAGDEQGFRTHPAEDSSHLIWSTHVAVDERGFIYVSDYSGRRVAQLDSDLTYLGDIVGYEEGLRNPRNLCLDSSSRRMYVAQANGSVVVFALHNLLPLY